MMPRSAFVFAIAIAAFTTAACGESAPPPAPVSPPPPPAPVAVSLPDSISFPEGIAYDPSAGALYTGSAVDGAIVRVKVEAGTEAGAPDIVTPGGTLVPAANTIFPAVLGMKVDAAKRLWIAGGRTGKIWVVNTADGTVLKSASVATAGTSLINDVALAGAAGYFTDTLVPVLWRVSVKGATIGAPERWLSLVGSPIEYATGPNLNGIAVTPDEKTLIVVHMGKGQLFKIDIATKTITPIATDGEDLTGADGLVLDGQTLYVVRQTANQIATLNINADFTSATVVSRFSNGLTWPATAAKVGNDLVVVNTQFNTRENNTTARPFTLLRVPLTRLSAK